MQKLNLATYGLALTTALALTACGGGGSDPAPQPQPQVEQQGTIYGQLVKTTASSVKPREQIVVGPDFVAKVNTSQQFDMPLPTAAVMDAKYRNDVIPFNDVFGACTSLKSNAPADLKILPLNLLLTDKNVEIVATTNNVNNFTYWWYANREATVNVSGQGCLSLVSFANQQFALKRGWNMVKVMTDGKTTSFQVGIPSAERLTFMPTSIGVSSQNLKPNLHMPWLDLPQYRNRQ